LYKDDQVTATITVNKGLVRPTQVGEKFGQVVLTVKGQVVDAVDLVAARSVGKVTLGVKLLYYWNRFARWLGEVF
ncbi:MAG: hypothetical protein H5T84_10785, partial [Thermoleophilia bacterium]|nr:hypothetical protein [Thermoleophilia bacterium]